MKTYARINPFNMRDFNLLADRQPATKKCRKIAHAWRSAKGIAPGNLPLRQRPCRQRAIAKFAKAIAAGSKKLRAMIKAEPICAARGNTPANSSALINNQNRFSSSGTRARRSKTGNTTPKNDKIIGF
jgi:hypothetical protein